MKRIVAALAFTAALTLGVTACSSEAEPAPEPETETVETATSDAGTETDGDTGEQAVLSNPEACLSLMEPLEEVNLAFVSIAEDAQSDPQTAIDMWRTLSDTFEEFGATVANPEVAALATAVGEDGHALTDAMQRVYVDQDMSAMNDFTTANTAFFESYEELLSLCNTTAP